MAQDLLGAINPSRCSISGEKNRWKMNLWHPHTQPDWLLVFTGGTAREQRVPGSLVPWLGAGDCCGHGVPGLLCSPWGLHTWVGTALQSWSWGGSGTGSRKPKGCPEHR